MIQVLFKNVLGVVSSSIVTSSPRVLSLKDGGFQKNYKIKTIKYRFFFNFSYVFS